MPQLFGFTQDTACLLNRPLSEAETYVNGLTAAEMHAVTRDLDALLERAARLRAYMDHRSLRTLDHAGAVKASNKLANAVRKLLGYTYPSTVSF